MSWYVPSLVICIFGVFGKFVVVQVGHPGTTLQLGPQGVGSEESSVTFGPFGGVPVAVAKLFT